MKYGILKGYKNNEAFILMYKAITDDYTLEMFHNDRCDAMDLLKFEYDRFETDLKNHDAPVYGICKK